MASKVDFRQRRCNVDGLKKVINACMTTTYEKEAYLAGISQFLREVPIR